MTAVEFRNVSRWYGNVVAVNDITMDIGPGVTGLLGPNGAGKSTILHMIAGFLEPSKGTLTLDGAGTWKNPEIYRRLGLVPERDSVYAFLTGAQFVTATAELLSNLVGGVRILSIAHYALGVADAIYPDRNLNAGLGLSTSLILAVVITAGGLYLATRRLQTFSLTGDAA
jgi:ABC-type cobalamin/Fe3+-siderophores transport system ATPase subunit